MHAQSLQSCLTLCDPMNCSRSGSSVYGILQARIREWVAMLSFRGSWSHRNWRDWSHNLTQGLKPHLLCLLHWRVGSLPLAPPGKPLTHTYTHTLWLINLSQQSWRRNFLWELTVWDSLIQPSCTNSESCYYFCLPYPFTFYHQHYLHTSVEPSCWP